MATDSVIKSASNTLSTTTVDTLSFTQKWDRFEVKNRSTTNTIWYLFGDSTVDTPTAGTAEEIPVGPGESVTHYGRGNTVFKVIGNGDAYTIIGYAGH